MDSGYFCVFYNACVFFIGNCKIRRNLFTSSTRSELDYTKEKRCPISIVLSSFVGVKSGFTLSGPHYFRYLRDRGEGGKFNPHPFNSPENW